MRRQEYRMLQMAEGSQHKFKEDLIGLIYEKFKDFSPLPIFVTYDLKNQIQNLQETFLELEQTKKFTEDKGVEILKEIDVINKELTKLARAKIENPEEEDRKRKPTSSKSKRKVCKCKKGR